MNSWFDLALVLVKYSPVSEGYIENILNKVEKKVYHCHYFFEAFYEGIFKSVDSP